MEALINEIENLEGKFKATDLSEVTITIDDIDYSTVGEYTINVFAADESGYDIFHFFCYFTFFCLLIFYSLGNTVLILSCLRLYRLIKFFNCIISNPHISLLPFSSFFNSIISFHSYLYMSVTSCYKKPS